MRQQNDRLLKLGIVCLAVLAVLGWIREPERHTSAGSAVPLNSGPLNEQSRTVFSAPGAADALGETELPGDNPEIVHAAETPRKTTLGVSPSPDVIEPMKRSPVEPTPAAVTRSEDPLANSGRMKI